jgi:16S rRNA (uracil1498-N3)-methyltransferase
MEQLFYAPDIASTSLLPEDESQHCLRVLRYNEGREMSITDGKGSFYKCILMDTDIKGCAVSIKEIITPQKRNFNIHIALAPTKNTDRMEWFVEKATEIGIDQISFLRCRRSERRELKLARLQKIAVSALKQSQKAFLPEINEMTDFKSFVKNDFDSCKMIAHCDDDERKKIREIYSTGNNALILIGPEGDFSSEEISLARDNGFSPVSLGHSRLRTETAAMVACHTIHLLNET